MAEIIAEGRRFRKFEYFDPGAAVKLENHDAGAPEMALNDVLAVQPW